MQGLTSVWWALLAVMSVGAGRLVARNPTTGQSRRTLGFQVVRPFCSTTSTIISGSRVSTCAMARTRCPASSTPRGLPFVSNLLLLVLPYCAA
jgi:hypothetical protein